MLMNTNPAQSNETNNPFASAPALKKRLTLIGIYVAALATRFISTGTFTVLPMAANDIGGMSIYPLASTVGGLMSICAMPVYGYIGSRYPWLKRTLLIFSLSVGAVVLLCEALAPSMFLIITVNFFYGIVSASIFVVAYSMIRDLYDAKQAGIYLGFIGTVTSIGMLAGPALTGIVIDVLGWRYFYHVGWILLLLSVFLAFIGVKVKREDALALVKTPAKFDLAGSISLMLFLLGIVMFLSLGGSYLPFGSIQSTAFGVLAVVALIVLIGIVVKKRSAAIIPSTVLKDRNTVVLALCNLFITCSTMALTFFMPSYVINVLHGTALQAGLTTAIYAVLGIFISPFLGRMIAKAGSARFVFTLGTIVRVLVTVAFILVLSSETPIWLIYILMLIAGFYSAQQNVTFSTAPQIQIRQEIRFMGNSVVQTAQNLGSSIGLAVYTLIMATCGLAGGMNIALIVAGTVAFVALFIGQFLVKAQKETDGPAGN